MISESEMKELVESAKPEIIKRFQKELLDGISCEIKTSAGEAIKNYIVEWVKKEILPELSKTLEGSKEGLLSLGGEMAPVIVKSLCTALTLSLNGKMKTSWERKKIVDALFG